MIEVALCEQCGADWLWSSASRAHHGLSGCLSCGSDRVVRCEREQTPEELERIQQMLRERKSRS
jgi:predicted  nucleic acid-binding Zn-ribbon protein